MTIKKLIQEAEQELAQKISLYQLTEDERHEYEIEYNQYLDQTLERIDVAEFASMYLHSGK